ncbi:MAG: hypothetical protein US51_C0011G0002 [Microgenomates group bacterium GW2011_GWA2_37_6]|nr:MAG: hypothetical protein US51_C0011G0002 [Microgenomates group bacterium GW2011_GWA2_37_6]
MKPLILIDFDGTMANTFVDSPNGFNVTNAYLYAIWELFGENGVRAFHERGGLRNSPPEELAEDIQRRTLQVDAPAREVAKQIVDIKLSLIAPEISTSWPRLYPGFKDFMDVVGRAEGTFKLGVLSSGHDGFISRVFEVNGFRPPDILVTNDYLSQRRFPMRQRYKPRSYQMAVAHKQWLNGRDAIDSSKPEPYLGRSYEKPRIVYIGDDPNKDGGLGIEARVPFIFVPFTTPNFVPDPEKGQLGVKDFTEVAKILRESEADLADGKSFARMLFGKEDVELFPPVPDGEVYRKILRERSFV